MASRYGGGGLVLGNGKKLMRAQLLAAGRDPSLARWIYRRRAEEPKGDDESSSNRCVRLSSVVLADVTGARSNCFLELGYALGRGLPTMVMAREGGSLPFDITTLSGLHWSTKGSAEDRRRAFREHWKAIRNRAPLVPVEPLIS